MKRREFIKNSLLTSASLLAACRSSNTEKNEKVKVVLIGIDAANWPTLDPLFQKGKLPFWKKLKDECAWADLQTIKPTKSSVVWTSIATGKRMEKHGILDFTYLSENKLPIPYNNDQRLVPAIWQMLDEQEKKSIVVNWFNSYPPDKINGIVVSDNFRRVVARSADRVNEFKDSVYPPIYFHSLLPLADRDYESILKKTGLADYPQQFSKLYPDQEAKNIPILNSYRSFVLQDYLAAETANHLFRTKDFDFFATYIRMPDLVQHFSPQLFAPDYLTKLEQALKNNSLTPAQKEEAIAKIADVIEPAYIFSEGLIKSLMSYKRYEDAYFIIVSDHGFSLYPGGYTHYDLPPEYPAPPGIIMIKGPKVKKGRIESASVYDIAPTILTLFNQPLDNDMDGKPLLKTFELNRSLKYKHYVMQKSKRHISNQSKEDTIEEIKSFGYFGTKKKK